LSQLAYLRICLIYPLSVLLQNFNPKIYSI